MKEDHILSKGFSNFIVFLDAGGKEGKHLFGIAFQSCSAHEIASGPCLPTRSDPWVLAGRPKQYHHKTRLF